MPLVPQQVALAIQTSAPFVGGPTWIPLTQALGNAIVAWAVSNPANLSLTGVTSGVLGAGTVTGSLTVPPNPALVLSFMNAAGIVGTTSAQLATAIAIGVSSSFSSSALYTGPSVGVSTGTDISTVSLSNPVTLGSLILSSMGSTFVGLGGIAGAPTQSQVAFGIGNGVASMLSFGFTTPATGIVIPVTPAPGSGVGASPLSIVL